MTSPADQAARDLVRTGLSRTLFLEAGAGTGKTTALVARVLELARTGTPMAQIAAITFTEAAAAELRERVSSELERAARREPALAPAAAAVDEAAVSTLHAFAQRILAEHPLEAGLPPAIEVMDEIESALAFDQRWEAFLDVLLDDPAHEPMLLRAFALGLANFENLREVAVALESHRDRLAPDPQPPPPIGPVDAEPVLAALRTAVHAARHCTGADDLLAGHLDKLATDGALLAGAGDELEVLSILDGPDVYWAFAHGRQENWPTLAVEEVRADCRAAEDARKALLDGCRQEVLAHLLHLVTLFTLDAAATRRASGRLDFHDLLVEARDLLRTRPDVRRALRGRFTHLLIDEFQDTDPLQVELAVLIAARDSDDPKSQIVKSWRDVAIEPGRLFFVGDPKQSIYRFRRADIGLFLEIRDAIADEVAQLTTNFRSVPGVLAWVNDAFGALIGPGAEGAQAAYEPLDGHRSPLGDTAPVVVLGHGHDLPIGDVRQREAAEIANIMVRIVEQEAWPVVDRDSGAVRPAKYSDIAILLPTRVTLSALETALDEESVPFVVQSSSLVWSTQEIRDLLSVLRAIDDPTDEVALVASLRSPAFACRDRDLLEFRTAGGRWRLDWPCPPTLREGHPVCHALDALRELHDQSRWNGVAAMVDRVVRGLRLQHLAVARPRHRDRWRRLRFVLDQAQAFEEAGGRTLREFLAWAERQSADDARVREPVLPEPDDDAVRLLTVHGAKGLEFPVVVLTGLNRAPARAGGVAVYWSGDHPEVRMGKFRTAGFAEVQEEERKLSDYEQLRLLYVAATRARDHLVVSVHHKAGSNSSSQAAALAERLAARPDLWRRLGEPLFRLQATDPGRPPRPDPEALVARQRWAASRDERVAALGRAPVRSATAIAAAGRDLEEEPDPDAPPWRRGRAGTSIGRAVHAVLQSVDLYTGDGLEAIAAAQAAAEGVEGAAAEVARLARAALASDTVREAVAGRHWRELYVGAPSGGVIVEGFVDLAYEPADAPGTLVIVDYKTDMLPNGAAVDAAVQRYRLQLGAYALALEAALGCPVRRGVLVFLAGGVALEREIGDLGAAADEVSRMLASL